jgi:hypothetical protein
LWIYYYFFLAAAFFLGAAFLVGFLALALVAMMFCFCLIDVSSPTEKEDLPLAH